MYQSKRLTKVLLPNLFTVETGQWNGMISNLVNGDADLITAPLTKCCERTEAVDFLWSFSTQSLGFVIKSKYLTQSIVLTWNLIRHLKNFR